MTMECPQCKSPLAHQGDRFCNQCGHDLRAYYQSLGVPVAVSPGESGRVQAGSVERAAPPSGAEAHPSSHPQTASLQLQLFSGETSDYELRRAETTLGKGPHNALVIADQAVSTSHAVIRAEDGAYTISDLGSRNGTFVNGERLAAPHRLQDGDLIKLGRSTLTFRRGGESQSAEPAAERTEFIPPASPPPLTEESLAQAVIEAGLVAGPELERVRGQGRRLYRTLVDERLASEEGLRDLMSRTFQIPTVDLRAAEVDAAVVMKFPPRLARQCQVFPVAERPEGWTIAVADATDSEAVEAVKRQMRRPVELRLATAGEIAERCDQHYGPKLVGVLPSGEKLEYRINQPEIEIGKASHNQIVLTDPTVSNTHAVILARDGGYTLVDLESRNGTFVNGERLGHEGRTLRHGDKIQLGQVLFTFRHPAETAANATAVLSAAALEEVRRRAGIGGPPRASQTPASVPVPASSPPVSPPAPPAPSKPEAAAADRAGEEEKGEKKKKKKKKKDKDERMRAAYIGAVSRIVAQVLGPLLGLVATFYLARSVMSPSSPAPTVSDGGHRGAVKSKFARPAGSAAFQGGTFEASGVAHVNDTDAVLFVDDSKAGKVFWMPIDQEGKQAGQIQSVPLGAQVANPEGITYGGGYFYVVGSQSDAALGEQNALARFAFDAATRSVQGPVEVAQDLRRFLLQNVPELRGEGEKSGLQGGLNVEGIAWDPPQGRLLLGLRSPLPGGRALIIPLKLRDPRQPLSTDNLQVAGPQAIQLSLGGYGVRDLHYDTRLKSFLIISGAPETMAKADFKFWEWSGEAGGAPESQPREDIVFDRKLKPEGVTRVKLSGRDFVLVVCDASSYFKLDYLGQ